MKELKQNVNHHFYAFIIALIYLKRNNNNNEKHTWTGIGIGGKACWEIILIVVGPRNTVSLPSINCMDTDSPLKRKKCNKILWMKRIFQKKIYVIRPLLQFENTCKDFFGSINQYKMKSKNYYLPGLTCKSTKCGGPGNGWGGRGSEDGGGIGLAATAVAAEFNIIFVSFFFVEIFFVKFEQSFFFGHCCCWSKTNWFCR